MQGLGSPACAKLLTQWFSGSERGTAWSIWTASNNVGGFAAPWIAGGAAGAMGWRYGMWVPAACALAISSIIFFTITDKPTDAGFKPVEGSAEQQEQAAEQESTSPSSAASDQKDESAKASGGDQPSVKSILFKDVLPNPWVWLFALSYFFVYFVRQGASTWFVHYLMNVKGASSLASAAGQVSGLEIGGFVGSLTAGARMLPTQPNPGLSNGRNSIAEENMWCFSRLRGITLWQCTSALVWQLCTTRRNHAHKVISRGGCRQHERCLCAACEESGPRRGPRWRPCARRPRLRRLHCACPLWILARASAARAAVCRDRGRRLWPLRAADAHRPLRRRGV